MRVKNTHIRRSSEVRTSLLNRILGRIAGVLLWVLGHTLNLKVVFLCSKELLSKPAIFVFWHNCIAAAPTTWSLVNSTKHPMAFMTSASKDGALVEEALSVFGLHGVRGSSSRRGVQALMESIRLIRSGYSISITSDGPKGPVHKCKPGLIKLAQVTQVPIIPLRIVYHRAHRFKTWDRFALPYPGSKVNCIFQEPIYVPESLSDKDLELYTDQIEKVLLTPNSLVE